MCGHVGMAGTITPALEKLVDQLLIVDSLRGSHSTGVAIINSMANVSVAKQVGNPYELFDTNAYNKAFNGMVRCIIGHNRYATQGAVNKRNAHPYEFDNVVGAHNGTLTNRTRLDGTFAVDSEQIFNHINNHGVKDCLDKMQGAWALVWWDKVNETINFLRNKERSLYMCYNKEGNALFWASEYWMLSSVLSRNNIAFQEIELLKEDVHLSFEVDLVTGALKKPHAVNAPCTFVYALPPQQKSYFPPPTVVNSVPLPPPKQEKKSQPTGGAKSSKYICGSTKKDQNGTTYLTVHDEDDRMKDIRWYFSGIEPSDFVGEQIECMVYDYAMQTHGERWHRVNPSSVKLILDTQEDSYGQLKCNCMWCTGPIYEGERHAKAKDNWGTGDTVCESCMADPDLKDFVNFVEV